MKDTSYIEKPNFEGSEDDSGISDFDISRIFNAIKRNFIWIILLTIGGLSSSYLFLRYTKPVFESSSSLRLEVRNEGKLLGLQGVQSDNIGDLLGEIEFLKSELTYKSLIDSMPSLKISYFAKGNVLDNELYKTAPFRVKYLVRNPAFFDKPIYLKPIDQKSFELTYEMGGKNYSQVYAWGNPIIQSDFEFNIQLNGTYSPDLKGNLYFFILHSESSLMNYLRSNLQVSILNQTAKIISISFKDFNSLKVQDIVNKIDTVYLRKTLEAKNKANTQQIKYLDRKLSEVKDTLNYYESLLEGFVIENQTKNVDDKLSKSISEVEELLNRKFELNRQISTLQEMEGLAVQDSSFNEFSPIGMNLPDPQIMNSISELNQLKKERENYLYYKNENASVVQLKNKQIEKAKKNLLNVLNKYQNITQQQSSEVQKRIALAQGNFSSLPSKGTTYVKIKRSYDLFESFYLSMLNNKAEIEIAGAAIVPEFVILSPANLPLQSIYPKKIYIYGFGLIIGLALGFLLTVGSYLLDNTILSQKELEKMVQLPLLGTLPQYRKSIMKTNSKLLVHQEGNSSLNESFRMIRTNLDFLFPSHKKNAQRTLSITSTVSGEGKTFIAVNLGGIISMLDLKVIVLDLDLRKPKVHLAFDEKDENEKGISTILIGKHSYEECIKKTVIENLSYISSGPHPPNPSELMQRSDFNKLLSQLKTEFDVIICDTPPIGLVSDSMYIMNQVDVQLYVMRANYSKKIFAKNINKLYQQTGFSNMAMILNSVRKNDSYGYGKYYYNGYYGSKSKPKLIDQIQKLLKINQN